MSAAGVAQFVPVVLPIEPFARPSEPDPGPIATGVAFETSRAHGHERSAIPW